MCSSVGVARNVPRHQSVQVVDPERRTVLQHEIGILREVLPELHQRLELSLVFFSGSADVILFFETETLVTGTAAVPRTLWVVFVVEMQACCREVHVKKN